MDFSFAEATAFVGSLVWPMMRIGAMLMAMPVIGTRLVPTRAKIIITLVLSAMVLPLLPELPRVEALSIEGFFISAQQILIGLSMGFTLQLVFGALMIAGESIAMTMGLGFASMVDPTNGVSVPVVSQLFIIVGTLLFLSLGGHLTLIQLVVSSFETLPISATGVGRDGFWALFAWGSQMFIGALWVAIPALISMLVITLSMGVMTRAAPQLNIFSVGFPVTMFMGFVILILVMPGFLPRFNQMMLQAMQLSQSMVTP
ncbi:MAG: flagellar biosynthetic protein FliR [Gammaproteobacteria bacterium]|nr:flagellar biosynthetic protein FliR [Gammaproteobacteria bacterium]MDH3449863.1 flagellar biosynthetic protein FliR [Gammaproteobacteria bacterium]